MSDAQTILSKLFVALVLVPLGVLLLAAIIQPVPILVGFLAYDGPSSLGTGCSLPNSQGLSPPVDGLDVWWAVVLRLLRDIFSRHR